MHFNFKSILIASGFSTKEPSKSMYINLYDALKKAILNKTISVDLKLPSSRVLAKDLTISRSTVNKAFELLVLEKLIVSKQGSGHYINPIDTGITKKKQVKINNVDYPTISKSARLFINHPYKSTDNFSKENIAFRPGLPPLDIFPVKKWKHLTNEYWRNITPTLLSYAPSEGVDSLRISIANYLKMNRNISCDYDQIIIGTGSLHSLYLIANSLIDKNDTVIMENPTFPRAYNLFKSLKAKVIPCQVDDFGLRIKTLKSTKAKLIYTTPSNQYPLGVVMSLQRRKELLEWVSKRKTLIIEDDYDHEFSNWSNPLPSIYSLDKEEKVIYLGTFNKLLHPSLRIGYMIVPKYLVPPVKAIYEQSSRFVNVSIQEVLSQFINNNYLNLHLRNIIKVSKERRKLFLDYTKNILTTTDHSQGLHIIGNLTAPIDDTKASKVLLKSNVVAYPLSKYYIGKEKKQGLVLGFSSVNNKVMKEKTEVMNRIFMKK